jgi:triosephosphate isomerase
MDLAKKAKISIENNLNVIFCIGENNNIRELGGSSQAIASMLDSLKDNISCDDWMNVIIAYEPVWALLNNQEVFPEEINKVHMFIRKWIRENVDEEISK